MARILSVEACPAGLRNQLLRALRPSDECVLLPQAECSVESQSFKNIAFTLSSIEPEIPVSIFSSKWFDGVSAVRLDDRDVEPLLRDPERRKSALEALANAIQSETADSTVAVGPGIDGDDNDRDKGDGWEFGFDGPTCLVGLFCSEHSRAPDVGLKGQHRVHRESYLVARAGGGVAAQTFHTRLLGAARKGKTLTQALEHGAEPGPQGLRRVSMAGTRNRSRILLKAAEVLGFSRVATIGDQPSQGRLRGAVLDLDVQINTLRRVENQGVVSYAYCTGVDCSSSLGCMVASNLADGFLLYVSSTPGQKLVVRNEAGNSVPFATPRLKSSKHLAEEQTKSMLSTSGIRHHVDAEFISERFSWRNRDFGPRSQDVVPFGLVGSHSEETFAGSFGRELGLAQATQCRLHPELVVVAGVEASKLRPMQAVLSA